MQKFFIYCFIIFLILGTTAQAFQKKQQKEKFYEQKKLIKSFIKILGDDQQLFQNMLNNFENDSMSIDAKCIECKLSLDFVDTQEKLKNIASYILDEIVTYLCAVEYELFPLEVCQGAIDEMSPYVLGSLWDHYASKDFVCPALDLCPQVYEKVDIPALIEEILSDKPEKPQLVPTSGKTVKFMHMSDIHSDDKYDTQFNAYCEDPNCCVPSSGLAKDESEKAEYWGTIANCDLPTRTFRKMIEFINKNLGNEIDFSIWTGDNTNHSIWDQTYEANLSNSKQQTNIIQEIMPNAQFYPIMGNHESYPVNIYDFTGEREAKFNDFFSQLWSNWLDQDAQQQLKEQGFYETTVKGHPNLKLIAMNTQAGHSDNFTLMRNPTDPKQQLEKLRDSLKLSEDAGQAVYLIGHIPSGAGWFNTYAKVYNAILERFSYTVRGVFTGHTHNDQYELHYDQNFENVQVVNWIAPSVTTYEKKNPSFRIVEVDSETYQVMNIIQYRMDLDYWNQFTDPNTDIQFEAVYNFKKEYNLDNLYELNNLDKLRKRVATDLDTYNKYIINYHSGIQEPQTEIQQKYQCKMLPITQEQYKCLGLKNIPYPTEVLAGPWIQKIKKQQNENIEIFEIQD